MIRIFSVVLKRLFITSFYLQNWKCVIQKTYRQKGSVTWLSVWRFIRPVFVSSFSFITSTTAGLSSAIIPTLPLAWSMQPRSWHKSKKSRFSTGSVVFENFLKFYKKLINVKIFRNEVIWVRVVCRGFGWNRKSADYRQNARAEWGVISMWQWVPCNGSRVSTKFETLFSGLLLWFCRNHRSHHNLVGVMKCVS